MLHLLLPACGGFFDCSYLLADKASPPDNDWFVEMARLVALRYGSESASAPGCLCDGTGTLYRVFSVDDHNPIAVCLMRESPCFAGGPSEHEHCAGKKIAVNIFYAARLRRSLSNDVPEH